MKKMLPLILVLGLIILFGGCGFGCYFNFYNSMIDREADVDNAWAQVQNQYQRRHDLVPQLVSIVEGYAAFEQETLNAVIKQRNQATQLTVTEDILDDPIAFRRLQEVQGELSSMMTRLLAISESYPDLKASQGFQMLQSQVEGTENRISVERRRYNNVATGYNKYIKRFPNFLFAGSRFKPKELFTADQGAEKAPIIDFE
jgi:LemA protein